MNFSVDYFGLQPFYADHQALIAPLVTYAFTGFVLLFYTALAQELDWRYQRLEGFNEFD